MQSDKSKLLWLTELPIWTHIVYRALLNTDILLNSRHTCVFLCHNSLQYKIGAHDLLSLNQHLSKQWRRHQAHYDVIVMPWLLMPWRCIQLGQQQLWFNQVLLKYTRLITRGRFHWHGFTSILISIITYGMKLLIHYQTSIVSPLKFGKW